MPSPEAHMRKVHAAVTSGDLYAMKQLKYDQADNDGGYMAWIRATGYPDTQQHRDIAAAVTARLQRQPARPPDETQLAFF